jgi:hypothetical protein
LGLLRGPARRGAAPPGRGTCTSAQVLVRRGVRPRVLPPGRRVRALPRARGGGAARPRHDG